jgi:hypothetical protein
LLSTRFGDTVATLPGTEIFDARQDDANDLDFNSQNLSDLFHFRDFPSTRFRRPHAGAPAVLGDELDAGGFKSAAACQGDPK